MTCVNCDDTGRVWCRVEHSGVTGTLPCECRHPADSYLDTRPQERAYRYRNKWLDLRSVVHFALWRCERGTGPTRVEVDELLAKVARAFWWYTAWNRAEVGR